MKEVNIEFTYKTRYYTKGELGSSTKNIWFVLHGYGQLAKYFLNKFNIVSEAGAYVIAPEGLSKFYLEDVTSRAHTGNNRVGATWMTRENRLTDIENYITYLNRIYYQMTLKERSPFLVSHRELPRQPDGPSKGIHYFID
jgi:hypothetical protein